MAGANCAVIVFVLGSLQLSVSNFGVSANWHMTFSYLPCLLIVVSCVNRFKRCLGVWLSGCLVVWLSGCLVVWLSGCLVVWLSGCLDAVILCYSP